MNKFTVLIKHSILLIAFLHRSPLLRLIFQASHSTWTVFSIKNDVFFSQENQIRVIWWINEATVKALAFWDRFIIYDKKHEYACACAWMALFFHILPFFNLQSSISNITALDNFKGNISDSFKKSINAHWLNSPPQTPAMHYAFAIVFFFMAVFGLTGNALVIYIFAR